MRPELGLQSKLLLDDFSFDVTDALKYGAGNVLALRVADNGLPIVFSMAPDDGGICGPVLLDFANAVSLDEMKVAANPVSGAVRIEAKALNASGAASALKLRAELTPFTSDFYKPPVKDAPSFKIDLGGREFPEGRSSQKFSFSVRNPIPWDVDRPFLYLLRVIDSNGKLIANAHRFKASQSPRRFLLNAIRSASEHEHDPIEWGSESCLQQVEFSCAKTCA
jgi:hypothetical protein